MTMPFETKWLQLGREIGKKWTSTCTKSTVVHTRSRETYRNNHKGLGNSNGENHHPVTVQSGCVGTTMSLGAVTNIVNSRTSARIVGSATQRSSAQVLQGSE